MADRTLDLRHLKCPLPVLHARKALAGMQPGELLVMDCTDPMALIDIPVLVRQTGDVVDFNIVAPDTSIFLQTTAKLEKNQDLLFRAVGKKLHAPLATGTYSGTVRLLRNGAEVGRIATSVVVP